MREHQSSRTLVKSAPELWAECSDAASLARHLGAFGEIRITKLEPETSVAWEGDAASGTVKLEPSGWGTRVILTVTERPREPGSGTAGDDPQAPEVPRLAFDPAWAEDGAIAARRGKLRLRLRRRDGDEAEPAAPEERTLLDEAEQVLAEARAALGSDAEVAPQALDAALDSLGRAHHRPFSRG
jgi:hypothetical protein